MSETIKQPTKGVMKVAKVIDNYTLVINKGSEDGIIEGQRILVYSIGEEILDPDTKESLGKLEIIKGTGKVTHVQPKQSTLGSDMKASPGRSIRRNPAFRGLPDIFSTEEVEILPENPIPFGDPMVGDLVRTI